MPKHDETSVYRLATETGFIEVRDDGDTRLMHFGRPPIQSAMSLADPAALVLPYTRAMMAFLLFRPVPRAVLLLGLGGGSLVKFMLEYFNETHITAVDLNADVVSIAHQYFGLPHPSERLSIAVGDASDFVREQTATMDTLLVDVFDEFGLPERLMNPDFYGDCHACLEKDGLMVANLRAKDADELREALHNVRLAFRRQTLCMTVDGDDTLIALAFKRKPKDLRFSTLRERAALLARLYPLDFPGFVANLAKTNQASARSLFM